MRNLKKVLALVLALVMSLSLVTIANAADFSDDADIDYSEAVDVMVAAGIIDGVGNNSFDPNGTLTREQAAKLITYMLLGENSEKLGVESSSFKDVAATRWSAPAIEYCVSLGIVDGAGDGNFYPAGKLTGYAFAKMLLTALGYDSEIEKFTSAGWTIPVATIGMEVGLDDGLETTFGSAELTRQEAAQMALNAIKAPLVQYPNKGNSVSVNGVVVDFTSQQYEYITTTIARTQTISDQQLSNSTDYTIEFGEKYLPKLELHADTDDFGRPSYSWFYDKKEIGTYIDQELLLGEFTAKVTGEDLYNLIGNATLRDANTNVYVYIDGETEKEIINGNADKDAFFFNDGNIVKTNTKGVGGTGNGVLTQVFEKSWTNDSRTYTDVTIVIINTYLAQANSDYSSKKDEATFTIWGIEAVGKDNKSDYVKNVDMTGDDNYSITVSGEDFDIADVKEDDIVLVTVAQDTIQTIEAPDVLSETNIDSFKKKDSLTVEGTAYNYANTAVYDDEVLFTYTGTGDTNLKDTTYNVYLDPYGYVIGVDEVESVSNYVFITGYDGDYSNLSNKTADMGAIFLDGTMKTIKVKTKDSSPELFGGTIIKNTAKTVTTVTTDDNSNGVNDNEEVYAPSIINVWCTYTVNDNDEYTLTLVDGSGNQKANQSVQSAHTGNSLIKIDTKRVQLPAAAADTGFVFGNDETVYINAETDTISVAGAETALIVDDVDTVTIGARNVSLEVSDLTAGSAAKVFKPINEIYTLYGTNNRDIIAVVTLDAEDSGSNAVYAYVTSDNVERESYDRTTKEYTWSREVVIDGELTEVTYVGDELDHILPGNGSNGTADTMNQGYWYELKLDSKGNVRKVDKLTFDTTNSNKYQSTVASVVGAWNNNTDVELLWDTTTASKLTFDRGTLWTNGAQTTGISVSDNVKVVVCNADGKGVAFDSVVDGYTGTGGLKSALNDLNDNFTGHVSAVYDGGRASVIILNCTADDPNYDGGTETEQKPSGDYSSVVNATAAAKIAGDPLNLAKAKVSDTNVLELPAHYGQNVKQQLLDALNYLGYEVTNAKLATSTWTFTVTKDGMTEEITCNVAKNTGNIGATADEYCLVDVDGTKAYYAVGATVATTKETSDKGTGYIVKETGDADFAYGDAYANGYDVASGTDAEIKKGYVKLTVANTIKVIDGLGFLASAENDYVLAGGAATITIAVGDDTDTTVKGTCGTTATTKKLSTDNGAFSPTGALTAAAGSTVAGIASVTVGGTGNVDISCATPGTAGDALATYTVTLTVTETDDSALTWEA